METKIPKSMIAGVMSIMPVEVTKHQEIRPISVGDPLGVGIFQRTLNIVMYYKEEGDSHERGWLVAGWIKESLGRAMTEQPMISGRLQRRKMAKEEDVLEVVANDSGIRMIEAKFQASLPEFLEMVKRDKRRAEAEIVFWKDIDEVDPQFSPLFYVQVTSFESGGYSIGISCSIIIADLLLETDFLTKWAQLQTSLAHSALKSIFHLPSLQQYFGNFLTEFSRSDTVLDRGEPLVFQAKTCPKMSLACMKKTLFTLEKASADVFLFVKKKPENKGFDGTKVKIHSRDEAISDCDCSCDLEEVINGEVLNMSLAFGKKLEDSSCWFGSVSKGVVFVVPTTFVDAKSLAKFIVAFPKKATN